MEDSRKGSSQVHFAQSNSTFEKCGTTSKLGLIKERNSESSIVHSQTNSANRTFQIGSQHAINVYECNGLKHSSEDHLESQKIYTESSTKNQSKDLIDSKNDNGFHSSSAEDDLNGNKKSSIEQKRFYHRKFSVIPGVGRFFKLFRSPLERRNSCPVLSISEKDLTAAVKNNTILKSQTTQPQQNSRKVPKNQKKRSCCLTKWVSHSELLQTQLNQRVIPLQSAISAIQPSEEPETALNTDSNILQSSESQNYVSSLVVKSNNPVIENRENSTTETSSYKLSNGNIESFVVEKTVIIVSEKTALNIQNSEGISYKNNLAIPGEVSSIKQESLSMNSNYSHINVQSYTNQLEVNQEQTVANQVKVLYSNNNENSVSINNIQIPETKTRDVGNQSVLLSDKINCNNKTSKSIHSTEYLHQNECSQALIRSPNSILTNGKNYNSHSGDDTKLFQNLMNRDSEVRYLNKLNLNNHDNNINDKNCDDYKIKTVVEFESNENVKPSTLVSTFPSVPNDVIYATVSKIGKKKTADYQDNIYLSERVKSIDHKESEKCNDYYNTATNNSKLLSEQFNGSDNDPSSYPLKVITQAVNVVCNKETGEINCQKAEIKINCLEPQHDSLDFGENHSSISDVQSSTINECYNVTLDAPEEVIVSGFHDFCHTMLSLEDILDSNETGTIKRRPHKKKKDTLEKNKLSSNQSEKYVDTNVPQNVDTSLLEDDKLLEEIQNTKLIEKMSIKDPDVIDAIRLLDKSLMDESDDSIESPSIESSQPNKEDKIQCDNLIEELMLEDISAPRGNIEVTISSSEQILDNKTFLSIESNINNFGDPKKDGSFDVNNYNTLSSDAYGSDFCDRKKVHLSHDSFYLPVSDDTSATVDHSPQDISPCNRTSPCSVDSGMSSQSQSYFVVVAIDFGTTYSGYAFCFTRDPDNIHMMKKWDGGDPGVFNQKTPTTLLLSPEGTFHSFGYSARDYYHDLDVEEAKNWLYFEKFKMTLHHSEYLSLDTEIAAANGKKIAAVTVFAHALSYFKDHALQELSDQSSTKILNEDVRWVVTVPAIWKQPAKQFMRAAAYKAGIASSEYPDQLLIALEPEAASIYCRRMKLHQLVPDETHFHRSSFSWKKECESEAMNDKDANHSNITGQGSDTSFSIGTRYMVVDCGGGTVDITVHQLLDAQGTLKELKKASGGPYGSIGVDMEFEKLLCDIFGKDFIQQFKSKRPTGFVDLMIAFESRKRNANPYKANPLNISLPFSFIDFYKKYKGSSVESALKKSSHKNVKWSSQGMLRLESSAMERLFQKTVSEICKHIDTIISEKDMNIDHIFLVGGFAESLILQKDIKDAFSSKLKVIIPQGVSLAILKGAVLFGLDPTAVNIRRLRMTYGVGILNRFIHGVHPREKLVIKDGVQWCADVFDKFVVNEQSVGVGDVVVRRYTPAKDGQSCSVIHIYCSEKDNAYFITDPGVKRCATLILDLSDSRYIQDREIQTQMMFGDTEIKVSALDVTTGKCVKAEVDFLNQ